MDARSAPRPRISSTPRRLALLGLLPSTARYCRPDGWRHGADTSSWTAALVDLPWALVVVNGADAVDGLVPPAPPSSGLVVGRVATRARRRTATLTSPALLGPPSPLDEGALVRLLTVLPLRAVLAAVLVGSLLVQVVLAPLLWADLDAAPTWVRASLVTVLVLGLVTLQVTAVCVWRLVTMARRGTVLTPAAFPYVDVAIGAVAAAAVLTFALAVVMAPGEAVAPGVVGLVCGAALVVGGVALVVVLLRRLLAQAIARDVEARALEARLAELS